VIGVIGALAACGRGGSNDEPLRGRGLVPASLPPTQRAQVYTAALQASFDFGPSLVLLLDPHALPRRVADSTGRALPPDVVRAMLGSGTFQGTCRPAPPVRAGMAPRCPVETPGYVVRVSDVFRGTGDTLQVYAEAKRYDTARSGAHKAFTLEEVYQLVRRDRAWVVVRKGRLTSAS
jgi:hypothetical protein